MTKRADTPGNASKTALVTGASSGLGFEAAAQLAHEGFGRVIVTARTMEKAESTVRALSERTRVDVFRPAAVDLSIHSTVNELADQLRDRQERIDVLLLNAGLASGPIPKFNAEGVESTFSASVVGHHLLTVRLLNDGALSPHARIVISGSEAARNDVPMMSVDDIPAFADEMTGGNLVEAMLRTAKAQGPGKFNPMNTYANAKAFVAWWAAALSRKLPAGMTVNAVSPGGAPETNAMRNQSWFMRVVMPKLMKYIGRFFSMAGSVEQAARRYIDATTYDETVTGVFFASPAGKLVGPVEVQRQDHILHRPSQEAAYQAVVSLARGADLNRPEKLAAVS